MIPKIPKTRQKTVPPRPFFLVAGSQKTSCSNQVHPRRVDDPLFGLGARSGTRSACDFYMARRRPARAMPWKNGKMGDLCNVLYISIKLDILDVIMGYMIYIDI